MSNLRKKIYLLLVLILSLFSVILFLIYNVSIYDRESTDIKSRLIRINTSHEKVINDRFENKNPIFIDDEIYVVKFNMFGEIGKIVSYSEDGLNEQEIVNLINNNIGKIKKDEITSLYTSDYIFFLNKENNLIIMNNSSVKQFLIRSLLFSLLLIILLEVAIIYLSKIITSWIVKPVIDSFDKQKQFISDASHELKTPLAIISASAETIEGKVKDKKWIDNIKEETERMNHLVTNLLELSRTEDMKEKEVYSEIDLSKIIENKALSFESLMFENDLSLETNIEKKIKFSCSQDRIKELLSILIDNAIKHGEKKSIIKVELIKDKNYIYLLVTNKGIEIPESEQEKIFERFYRGDVSRNRDENRYGLGLSIAKNIVENHNGEISVDCKDGYTTFKVILKQN